MKKSFLFAGIILFAVLLSGCTTTTNTATTNSVVSNLAKANSVISNIVAANTNAVSANQNTNEALPGGAILVEGETGSLTNQGAYSYIGTSARGGEAYLGDGGAVATYTVQVPTAGKYVLSLRLDDDGKHADGARNATVTQRDQTLSYTHVSDNTYGWKWFTLGNLNLTSGDNIITFTKDKTTSATFVMDAFKLVPFQGQ